MEVIILRRCEIGGVNYAPKPSPQEFEDETAERLIAEGVAVAFGVPVVEFGAVESDD